MRFNQSYLAVSVIATILALPTVSWAKSELDLRITRLENIVQNELNINLLNQLDAMQQEIRELHGKLEEQQNALQAANQKQEKLFLNLDSRVNNLAGIPTAANEVTQLPVVPTPAPAPKQSSIVANEPELPIVIEATPAPVAAVSTSVVEPDMEPTPPPVLVTEKSAYNAAYSLMHTKKYEAAITEFKDYVWQFPEGEHAANAYYWLGEIYLLQWQQNSTDAALLEQAKESFSVVTNKYHGSPKETDALLKLGLIEIDLGNVSSAKEVLQQVIKKQPNSSHARLAESKLKALQVRP